MHLSLCFNHQKLEEVRCKPVDRFKHCPACGCKHLIRLDPDVVCSQCDWNSAAWDVNQGSMDNLLRAAKEFTHEKSRAESRNCQGPQDSDRDGAA